MDFVNLCYSRRTAAQVGKITALKKLSIKIPSRSRRHYSKFRICFTAQYLEFYVHSDPTEAQKAFRRCPCLCIQWTDFKKCTGVSCMRMARTAKNLMHRSSIVADVSGIVVDVCNKESCNKPVNSVECASIY